MAADAYRVVTRQSWGSRLGGAFKGIVIGLVLFIAAFPLLFWNEGRAVKQYKSLQEGAGAVVSVSCERVDPANEGRLVHTTGRAETDEVLTDPTFDIAQNALRLRREVEMFQWKESARSETKKNVGGSTETVTTYTYSQDWSDRLLDSSGFHQPEGHRNPDRMPFDSLDVQARNVRLGQFRLADTQVSRVKPFAPLVPPADAPLPAAVAASGQRHGNGFYLGASPATPAIGDARVTFAAVLPTEVSLAARQTGDTFAPYPTKAGNAIDLFATGTRTAEELFAAAHAGNRRLTWILRAVGFVVMFVGLTTLLKPLSVLADVLPLLGRIVGAGAGLVALLVAAPLSLITIAVAWIVYRPLLGIALLAAAAGLLFFARTRLRAAPVAQT